ncbi:DNA-processing protein DprA [Balneolales bacterium ANBcel1]|nr:DNA-processing protein DprA [Balneolales bacterium ANBcel1]
METERPDRLPHIRALLALSMIPSLGAAKIGRLARAFSPLSSVFSMDRKALTSVPGIGGSIAGAIRAFRQWGRVDAVLEQAEQQGIELLVPQDPDFPALLREIPDPPLMLWVRGALEALNRPGLAVVGTRNPSTSGREATVRFTRELLEAGDLAIISGLARGVDTLAHRTALEQQGCTVAVLGSGVNRIYPADNTRLAHKIIEGGGAVVSEYPPGSKPDAHHFPVRNRIVSGMALGVLVTETGPRGGSRITIDKALDQGREVFIVPHDIRRPSGYGCNVFIQRGWGKLVTCAADILEELPGYTGHTAGPLPDDAAGSGGNHPAFGSKSIMRTRITGPEAWHRAAGGMGERLCRELDGRERQIDELAAALNRPAPALLSVLLELELAGLVAQKPGKKFTAA